jgi:hypothetical protein
MNVEVSNILLSGNVRFDGSARPEFAERSVGWRKCSFIDTPTEPDWAGCMWSKTNETSFNKDANG